MPAGAPEGVRLGDKTASSSNLAFGTRTGSEVALSADDSNGAAGASITSSDTWKSGC
jgi:hypothetical protein